VDITAAKGRARRLYDERVLQANEGCDLDFLVGRSPVISDGVTDL
jgi:hypothetical protein